VFVRSWQVGDRTATLTVPRVRAGAIRAATIEWTPDRPATLITAEWTHYRAGRDAAIADLALVLGMRVACVEV